MFCAYTRPRYQVSVFRTIGPAFFFIFFFFGRGGGGGGGKICAQISHISQLGSKMCLRKLAINQMGSNCSHII